MEKERKPDKIFWIVTIGSLVVSLIGSIFTDDIREFILKIFMA